MGWVINSMLTPERRDRIGTIISAAYQQHFEAITQQFRPILQQTMREAAPLVWQDLIHSIANHREQLGEIGQRYQADLIEQRIFPLVQQTIWPIVAEEANPVLIKIGQGIWNRISLWSFGWRYMYDALPLPQRDLTKKEFQRFVASEVVPMIKSYLPEIIDVQKRILERIANDPEVRSVVADSLQKISQDQQMRELAIDILRDVLVNNDRLNDVLQNIWNSPQAKQAINLTNQRLEFAITSIGQELFGDPHVAITPEFSRVLRYKVLKKDFHWFLVERGGESRPVESVDVEIGNASLANPFHIPVETRQ